MIISCQYCEKRIRIDAQKYSGKRIKMRCTQCSEIFVVEVPPRNDPPEKKSVHSYMQILIAHSDQALCDTVGSILSSHNFQWKSCHDGETALQLMDHHPPQVAIVDVALPGLFAFEVVEKVRNRPGLEGVKIMLLSSVYNKMAYKRRPNTLYGADDYIEKHHIPLELISKINRLTAAKKTGEGFDIEECPTQKESDQTIDEIKDRLQRAEELESALDPNERAALAKAQRLARIIASDISLYDEAKVAEGIRKGTFFELFATEIAEGRQHFLARIPASLPNRVAILDDAFKELIERFREEMHP